MDMPAGADAVRPFLPSDYAALKLGCRFDATGYQPQKRVGAIAPLESYSQIERTPLAAGDNVRLSDCVETMMANAGQTWLGRAGHFTALPDPTLAEQTYSAITGYTPSNPTTDQGTDFNDALAYWSANSIAGLKLASAVPLQPMAEQDIRAAIEQSGGVAFVIALAVEQQNQRCWEAAGTAGSWGLHCLWADEFDGAITWATTWGTRQAIDRSYFQTSGFVLGAYELDLVAA